MFGIVFCFICLTHEVCKSHNSTLGCAIDSGAQDAIKAAKMDSFKRQSHWVKRKDGNGSTSWRPRKNYRVSAKHWAENVNNQAICVA